MNLFYDNEQSGFLRYKTSVKPVIELREFAPGEHLEEMAVQGKIIFLLKGNLAYSFGTFENYAMKEKNMLFIPPGYRFTLTADSNSRVIIARVSRNMGSYGNRLLDAEQAPRNDSPLLLNLNTEMLVYLNNVRLLIKRISPANRDYFEMKVNEMFYLFNAIYPREHLVSFFCEIMNSDAKFFAFVLRNHHKYRTLQEMAAAMNLTLPSFERRCKKIFGIPGRRLINEHRARSIYYALRHEETNLKEISYQFGFSSQSSFNDFCKKNLGATPGKIRKQPGDKTKNILNKMKNI